jgi:DNA polymerase IV
VRVLRGVGTVTEKALQTAGLSTVGDLQTYQGDLRALVGSWGRELKQFAFGHDDRPVATDDEVKSISSEDTFQKDTGDRPALRACLREQARAIATRLARHRLSAWTVCVKVRYGDFTTLSRQISVEEPIASEADIYRLGCWLLAHHRLVHRPLRLLGLGVSNVTEVQLQQLHLFKS